MSELGREALERCLSSVIDEHLDTDLITAGAVAAIEIADQGVRVAVELGYPASGYREELTAAVTSAVRAVASDIPLSVECSSSIGAHAVQPGLKPIPSVKNIIAVASGKGGVGKSTVAANLALALQAEGARVGLLDADVYGPSQPRMLGLQGRPQAKDERQMEPMIGHGLQVMSVGLLIDAETPTIWRGPMATRALEQLFTETAWEALDYLIVDMPPGTGDIQLTLAQKIPVSGAVVVTTPQEIALLDARKGLRMFEQVGVPVLGVVENMAHHLCSQCGHAEAIFGSGGGTAMAEQYGVRFLGSLPLAAQLREDVDRGQPSVVADPDGRIAGDYRKMARRVAAELSLRPLSRGSAFPEITVP
ncbi:Fe-S-binding ATPase [Halorhodospira abdelmalekii]|uniref:iron-sulfur cluster carrier protein ApbC n=1 Tax=Halorhodospira abdelmalekii TaxID=421629 RepID=UPI0019074F01|nr:iron-sulfur cluster carrier protein ApbC [Halorhodospira abdelmalekii]MBK1734166.1 Fe-S-binding ATPase [Halorhodospira abdelmalekii]